MSGKDRVVRLHDGGGGLRSWIDAELQLDLLAEVNRQALHEQGTESRSSSATEGVENEETLQTGAVISDVANLVENLIDQLLSDSVMTTSVVVGRILLSSDHLLRVKQGSVCTGSDLIDNVGLEIAVDGTGDVFALTCVEVISCMLEGFRI